MFMSLKLLVLKFWAFWTGMFAPLPYGDPYLAYVALFMVLTMGCTLLVRQHS